MADLGCYKVLDATVREWMRQNVSHAISNVAEVKPGIPIVMFGYSRPTMVPNECIVPTGPGGTGPGFATVIGSGCSCETLTSHIHSMLMSNIKVQCRAWFHKRICRGAAS